MRHVALTAYMQSTAASNDRPYMMSDWHGSSATLDPLWPPPPPTHTRTVTPQHPQAARAASRPRCCRHASTSGGHMLARARARAYKQRLHHAQLY